MPRVTSHVNQFFNFMRERHLIYTRRYLMGNLPPWTDDPVLQKYRFCNVYRELDKTTIWIREHMREPYKDHPNLWFLMVLARCFNYIPSLVEVMQKSSLPDKWDPYEVAAILKERQNRGEKIFTSAYVIGGTDSKGMNKIDRQAFNILDTIWRNPPKIEKTLEGTCRNFLVFTGISGFLAYEFVTDLRHTRYLCLAPDIMTWANAGPGASRGLNRVYLRPVDSKVQTPLAEMRELLAFSRMQEFVADMPLLEMRDIEHTLCEFDKYERARCGQGAPKELYRYGK